MGQCVLFGISVVLMIILIYCIFINEDGFLPVGRDEQEDLREDPYNLLREDTLWNSSAEDHIKDPYQLTILQDSPGQDKGITNISSEFIAEETPKTNLLSNKPPIDYMGHYEYNLDNLYTGKIFQYPTPKVGGAYLSQSYKLSPEDEESMVRHGLNYYNYDFISPDGGVYQDVAAQISNETHTTGNSLTENFASGENIGLTTTDGIKNYMSIKIDGNNLKSTSAKIPYDDAEYENGGPPREHDELVSSEFNRPESSSDPHTFYRYGLDYYPESSGQPYTYNSLSKLERIAAYASPENNLEQNFYNVTNVGSNLDINNGAYEQEINISEFDNVDSYEFTKTGPMDHTYPTAYSSAPYAGQKFARTSVKNLRSGVEPFLSSEYPEILQEIQFNPRAKWKDVEYPNDKEYSKLEQFIPTRGHTRSDIDFQPDSYEESVFNTIDGKSLEIELKPASELKRLSVVGDVFPEPKKHQYITYPRSDLSGMGNQITRADVVYEPTQIQFPDGEQTMENALGPYRNYNPVVNGQFSPDIVKLL